MYFLLTSQQKLGINLIGYPVALCHRSRETILKHIIKGHFSNISEQDIFTLPYSSSTINIL